MESTWDPARFYQQQAALSTTVLTSPSSHLASLLISHLSPETYGSCNLESFSGRYFFHIPSRIGHNDGLDSAVKCICKSHSMFLKHVPRDMNFMRSLYLDAIGHLQDALGRPNAEYNPEILCASMLLRLFEVVSSTNVATYRCLRRTFALVPFYGSAGSSRRSAGRIFVSYAVGEEDITTKGCRRGIDPS